MNGFDRLAPMYDCLVRIVFGQSMVEAQTAFLHVVEQGSQVLILGGGTGWILVELLNRQPECEVWYVESSSRMIDIARKKCNHHHHRVYFILGTEQSVPSRQFDVVIMNFFLDLFTEEHIIHLLENVKRHTVLSGVWLITDFEHQGKWWQSQLLKAMILFFRVVCTIEARVLPDIKTILASTGVRQRRGSSFFHGFITSGVYQAVTCTGSNR